MERISSSGSLKTETEMGHRPIQKTDGSARTEAGLGFRRLTGASLTPFPTEAIYEPSQERQELFMVVAHDFVTQCLPSETRRDEERRRRGCRAARHADQVNVLERRLPISRVGLGKASFPCG